MKTHSSLHVADYLIKLAKENNDHLTPMQLLKLVYLCHGWMMGLYGRQLITESIQAWKYGPIITELYHAIKEFKDKPVSKHLSKDADHLEDIFDPEEMSIITQVYDIYGKYPGPALSRLTHQRGSPWDQTWNTLGRSGVISNDMIEDYFKTLAEQSDECQKSS